MSGSGNSRNSMKAARSSSGADGSFSRRYLTRSRSSSFMPRRQRHASLRVSVLSLKHHLLDLGDGLRRIEVLRAGLAAIHDGVAAIQAEGIVELVEPFARGFVA